MQFPGWLKWPGASAPAPRSVRAAGGSEMAIASTPEEIERFLRGDDAADQNVTPERALRQAVVYRCVAIIAGKCATTPLDVKRRLSANVREDASDHPVWRVLNRRPNRWQKPAVFKRMMQAHVLLRGNAYALKVYNARGQLTELIPLNPDRVRTRQLADLSVVHDYTRPDGSLLVLTDDRVLHLYGLTLNGYSGVSVIGFARMSIDSSLVMERHGNQVFRNGANVSSALKHKGKLSEEAHARLATDMQDFRSGGAREGQVIILEEGMELDRLAMSSADAQWIEARGLSRSDIGAFFGVPPHMYGDTEKSTSWGTGIDSQRQGFLDFSLEDHFVMWEEGANVDLLDPAKDENVYVRFNRNAFVRADLNARTAAYVRGLQWGWLCPDDVRELEDMNPRPDGDGGKFYDPPNTAGDTVGGGAPTDQGSGAKDNAKP